MRLRPNRVLRGWSAYFNYGARRTSYRAIDNYVENAVRDSLQRRHKVSGRGIRRFGAATIFGPLGVLRLRDVQLDGL